jgi:DNA primase
MGTALTAEQVGELARMAQTVLLALDADAAGQEAMLRAQTLAAKRSLELRVVPMAAGSDPAELIQREGAEAMRAAVASSVPFVRFQVERVLAAGDRASAEGKDRIVAALRAVFATVPPSAMRMELTRMVCGELDLPESLVERMLAGGARERSGGWARGAAPAASSRAASSRAAVSSPANGSAVSGLAGREETERAFLSLCIASPEEGARALGELDLDDSFSSELVRRAARHLRDGSLTAPMLDRPGEPALDDDRELKALLAELVVEAGREAAMPGMLEVQRLQLELARLDRQIQRARGRDEGDVSGLAQRRGEVKREFDAAYTRLLETTGVREG